MKEIKRELNVNSNDFQLRMSAEVDGKTVIPERKSNSLMTGFLQLLGRGMGINNRNENSKLKFTESIGNVNSCFDVGGNVRLTSSLNKYADPDRIGVYIYGVQGCDEANGFHAEADITVNGTFVTLNNVPFSNAYTGQGKIRYIHKEASSLVYNTFFINPIIEVGTGTTPETIDDFNLDELIQDGSASEQLTYNSIIISDDTNDATSSEITLTQSFSNNSGGSIVVNELSLISTIGNSSTLYSTAQNKAMIARDIITPTAIDAGKTLTINYKIKTTLSVGTDAGGFCRAFLGLLVRQLKGTARNVFDINNVGQSDDEHKAQFQVTYSGGMRPSHDSYEANFRMWQTGIIVGGGTTPVSMNDFYLEDPFGPETPGKEFDHYGTIIKNLVIGVGEASFDVVKVVENISGGILVINEIGITGGGTTVDDFFIPEYLVLLARNILTTPISVNDSELVKVIYTIKISI